MSRHARHDKIMEALRNLNSDGRILWWRYTYGRGGSLVWEIDTGEGLMLRFGTTHVEAFLAGAKLYKKETG